MAGNHNFIHYGMEQRQMDWQQIAPNERFQSQNHAMSAHALTSRAPPVMNNQMNTTYARSAAPPYGQYNNQLNCQRQISQAHLYIARVFGEARLEVCNQPFSNSHHQLMDSQFVKRKELQQLLASQCRDSSVFNYITSKDFLLNFDSPSIFEVVQRATGMDAPTLKKALHVCRVGSNMRPNQVQLNQDNSQGSQYVHKSAQNTGNFNQFQVQGANTALHNGAAGSFNQMNNMAYSATPVSCQPQRRTIPTTSESILENLSRLVSNTDMSSSQQQSRWYSMPTERYESGRIVQQTERQNPQVSLQSGLSEGRLRESAQQSLPRTTMNRSVLSHPNMNAERIHSQPSFSHERNIVGSPPFQNVYASAVSPNQANPDISQNVPRSHSADYNVTNCDQRNRLLETRVDVSSQERLRKSSTPPDSKEKLKQMLEKLESTSVKHVPNQNPQGNEVQSPVVQLQENLTVTKSHTIAENSESCVTERPDEPDDILDLFSMPVLNDDLVPKEAEKSTSNKKNFSNNFDDMNVLSPFTADIVSNTVDSWLSGSRRSEILDQLGLKSIKEKQHICQNKVKSATDFARSSGEESPLNIEKVKGLSDNSKETECPKLVPEGENISHSAVLKGSLKENETNTHTSLGEYDPPLPVIKHKKREDRISPLKKTGSATSSSSSHISSGEKQEDEDKGKQVNREPLFSVLDNLFTKTPEGSENQECSNVSKAQEKITQEQSSCLSAREKVYSKWSGKYKENENQTNSSKLHMRRKSCPDPKVLQNRTSKGRRSLTWDGTRSSADDKAEEAKDTTEKGQPLVPPNQEFVWIHGQKLLLVSIPEGHHIVMKEFIATCLADHHSTEVYRKKTSELNINNKTLTHSCRRDVQKYLTSKNISCPSQIDIVSLSNAQKLFHHIKGVKSCDEDDCVSMKPPLVTTPLHAPELDQEKKDRSVSPDSTVHVDNRSSASSTSRRHCTENDLQQNKVSSQSLDDLEDTPLDAEDDDASSSVSDATDLYCDGKPVLLESLCENGVGVGDGDGEGVSKCKLEIDFHGGLAVFKKEDVADRYLRFVNIRGNKCFLYQDLMRLFGHSEVVKVVVNDSMRVKTCSREEAEYLNRKQPDLIPVDPVDNSLIHEKYARKVFAYFGETFPKSKLPIDANLNKYKLPLKRTLEENNNQQPPSKKLHKSHSNTPIGHEGQSQLYGDSHVESTAKSGQKRKHEEILVDDKYSESQTVDDVICESRGPSMEVISKLKSHHLELAAELAVLKDQLHETKKNNDAMVKKCKSYEDDLAMMKTELDETKTNSTDLKQKCRNQEDALSEMRGLLEAKDEENQTIQKERDHYKEFLQRITDTYKVADDSGDEVCIYGDSNKQETSDKKKLKWHHYTVD